MSIPVELADLRAKTTEYTWAYLLTVRPDGTPHLVSVSPQWSGEASRIDDHVGDGHDGAGGGDGSDGNGEGGGRFVDSSDGGDGGDGGDHGGGEAERGERGAILLSVSPGTARNGTGGSTITLCYPPLDHDGYSLIIDGTATEVDPSQAAIVDRAGASVEVPDGKHLIRFAPTGAVLHRSASPGFAGSATGCANDCLPVDGT